MKICIKENEFNPSLLSQKWCTEDKAREMGYTIIEIADIYKDCTFEDFNSDFTFNIEKYNSRKQKEYNQLRILEIRPRLEQLSQDLIQAQAGAVFEDLEERKAEFRVLHNELRILLGKEPRLYTQEGLNDNN